MPWHRDMAQHAVYAAWVGYHGVETLWAVAARRVGDAWVRVHVCACVFSGRGWWVVRGWCVDTFVGGADASNGAWVV